MGNSWTRLYWGGDPDKPDPESGLTNRDITNIRKSWAPLWANKDAVGQELYLRFFRADPDTKTHFKHFRHLDEEHLPKNREFKAQVIAFMTSLNMLVDHLHEPDVAIAMLHKIGDSHKKHHIPKKHFDTIEAVLSEYLAKDQKLSNSTLKSWNKLISFMNPHIYNMLTASS